VSSPSPALSADGRNERERRRKNNSGRNKGDRNGRSLQKGLRGYYGVLGVGFLLLGAGGRLSRCSH